MERFFLDSVTKTIDHIKTLLQNGMGKGIKAILMVGGYSNSQVLQEAMKSAFQDLQIITPVDAETAVLKWAVIFGHDPGAIDGRVLQYTYGTSAAVPFIKGIHPESNKIINVHGVHCDNAFVVYASKGEMVMIDQPPKPQQFKQQFSTQREIGLTIFATSADDPPIVIDQTVSKVAELRISLEDVGRDANRRITFTMRFDGTTITAVARDERTGKRVEATVGSFGD